MATYEQIEMAIGTHHKWKIRLSDAIKTGRSNITVEKIGCDDQCALGMWLNGPAFSELKDDASYHRVKELHCVFHQTAAEVLELALSDEKVAAEKLMIGRYAELSASLVAKLKDWQTYLEAAA